MADKRKTMGLSACKRGLWGKKTKKNNATMPHEPRLHALGPIVSLRVRHSWIWRIGRAKRKRLFSMQKVFMWSLNALLIPKWRCCLMKPLILSAVRNDERMLRSKIFVCKCQGAPRDSTYNKFPGFARRVLPAGIDSHIWVWTQYFLGKFCSFEY